LPSQHTREVEKEIVCEDQIVVPLDLPEFRVVEQRVHPEGILRVTVIAKSTSACCPHCQRSCSYVHDCRERKKRDCRLRDYQVQLIVLKRRFRCRSCQHTFTEPDSACGRRRRTTRRLRQAIGKAVGLRPVAHVSQEVAIGPRFASTCFVERVAAHLSQRGLSLNGEGKLPTPRYLGIDEYAIEKGHRYATILCDLEKRDVLETCRGRSQEEVEALLERLDHPERVEAVSLDMSSSFASAVRKALPQAQLVIDHFHVIQHWMDAFRPVVSSWARKKEGQILLYRKQKLFLAASEDLTPAGQAERARIASHLPDLETAWKLKEELRTWYATATVQTAESELDAWMKRVKAQGPESLQKALPTFTRWKPEILAFFRFLPTRLSNGFVEGKNNRTKTMMRQAYGYRNFAQLRLRILMKGDV
jgi:transposase